MDAPFYKKIWYEIKFQMRKRIQSFGILSKVIKFSPMHKLDGKRRQILYLGARWVIIYN
jgi:hypothetical protein